MYISNIIFLITIIIIFIILFNTNFIFNHNIKILSKEETLAVLLNNNDNYYSKFTNLDLKVRKISSINEYKQKIKNCVCNSNSIIENKTLKSINLADNKIKNFYYQNNGYFKGIDINKLNNIKWNIGYICNNNYEQGLPHTRGKIIIMPQTLIYKNSINDLSKTLIHEKVHIYQKLYPNELQQYLDYNNFKKIKIRDASDNIRANPDMDNNIYTDGNIIYKAIYLPNANNITDVRLYNNNQKYEHPFEKMAIEISDACK